MERTGWFECSDPLLNQLHQNVVWGMRGNFLDVPTDCPQRDERLGWTGDLEVFSPTASFLYDASGFLQSWLKDLAIEQHKLNGAVPHVVPDVLRGAAGAAAWADAATVVPTVLYERFGDRKILADQFESMCAWVDHVASLAGKRISGTRVSSSVIGSTRPRRLKTLRRRVRIRQLLPPLTSYIQPNSRPSPHKSWDEKRNKLIMKHWQRRQEPLSYGNMSRLPGAS